MEYQKQQWHKNNLFLVQLNLVLNNPSQKASLLFSSWWMNFLNILISSVFYMRGRGGSGPYTFTSNEASSFWESPILRAIQKSVMGHFEKVWNSVCHTNVSWLRTFLFDLNDSNSTQDQGHSMKMWSPQLVLDSACQRFPLNFNPILWGQRYDIMHITLYLRSEKCYHKPAAKGRLEPWLHILSET